MRPQLVFATLFIAAWISLTDRLLAEDTSSKKIAVQTNADGKKPFEQDEIDDKKLYNQFRKRVYPLLSHPEKGCIDCHDSEGTSPLVFTGSSMDDFHQLLDEQYLKAKGADTLLSRVTTRHVERRMPKEAEPWSKKDIHRLKAFLHTVQDLEEESGIAADEQFPRSLLGEYTGEKPSPTENQFLTFWQLKGKIRVLFEDDWVRGDRDLFSENLATFGGADFKTQFNESSQPSASFLSGLEMLARDVANRAYEQQRGPFREWPSSDERASEPVTSDYRAAIQQLYERVLYRPATELELEEAFALLCGVFELDESVKKRDDELGFELVVRDPETGFEQREVVRIPVSGDSLQVRQYLVDQTSTSVKDSNVKQENATTLPDSLRRKTIAQHNWLNPNVPNQRIMIHNVDTLRNVSFAGLEISEADGTLVESIAIDSPKIEIEGAWQISEEDGFKSYEDRNQHKGMSSIRISLQPERAGDYQLTILWRGDIRNAKSVLVELFTESAGNQLACPSPPVVPPQGEAYFEFDCSTDAAAFASPHGKFQFSDASSVEISNHGTLDSVTAGAVEFVNANDENKTFLIDSVEADGNEQWQRFDEGRFKAYNVKGKKLHDGNTRKGELSLTYRPSVQSDQAWNADEYYRLRLYYPGKKEQECQVPVVVRAVSSSPIVKIVHPSLAKADAGLRIDASASYTVSHSRLEYTWRQVSGTRVHMNDAKASVLEFTVPRRSVEQVAWTSLCSALLRHPDFLFTRPPSLMTSDQPEVKQRLRLVKLALDLVGRPPTAQEVSQLANGTSLSDFTDRYLDSKEFRDFYFHRIRLNLESQGTEIQDEPVRLWSYIAFHDRPFQEILTANYTVDSKMQKVKRPAVHGKTGVLTTPGFIQGKPGLPHYNYAAQVSMLFLGFAYEVPAEIVDQREGVTALGTTDPNSVCYSCHKILTPLAFQRLNWNDEGEYRTEDDDGLPIDASDQKASIDYPFPGKGMEAFATQAVKKERFMRTMINTHVHFYLGRPMRFREDERVLYKRLWDSVHRSKFKIRELIREIVSSPEYLMP